MAGRIQGCDLDVVPALMGRLGSPCGTPDTSQPLSSRLSAAHGEISRDFSTTLEMTGVGRDDLND